MLIDLYSLVASLWEQGKGNEENIGITLMLRFHFFIEQITISSNLLPKAKIIRKKLKLVNSSYEFFYKANRANKEISDLE